MEKYFLKKQQILSEHDILKNSTSHHRGTVYTPEFAYSRMIYMLIKRYLKSKGSLSVEMKAIIKKCLPDGGMNIDLLFNEDLKASKKLLDEISKLSIMDISCGSGLLILAFIEFKIKLMKSMGLNQSEILNVLKMGDIWAIDINENAILQFERVIKALFDEFCEDEIPKSIRLMVADSLMEDLDVPRVDLIIGNPPYIGEKGNLDLFHKIKATDFGMNYYEGKMDYYYFFIYKGFDYLNEDGILCYLTSNYFLTADGAKKLRAFIKNSFFINDIMDFKQEKIFKGRGLHSCIYTLSKQKPKNILSIGTSMDELGEVAYEDAFDDKGTIAVIAEREAQAIIKKLIQKSNHELSYGFNVNQGIVSGADRDKDNPIFVYRGHEIDSLNPRLYNILKPFFKNSDIDHFRINKKSDNYILYAKDACEYEKELTELLSPHFEALSKRREVKNGVRAWFELTWPRDEKIFTGYKIVAPQRAERNKFALVDTPFYASADVYYISPKSEYEKYLKGLSYYLNSSFVFLYLHYIGKRKGEALELYASPLKGVPVVYEILSDLEMLVEGIEDSIEIIRAVDAKLCSKLMLTDEEIWWLEKFVEKNM